MNSLGCGLFFTMGDYVAQSLFPKEPDQPLDYHRIMRAGIYGSCFFAPISVLWHGKTLPKIKTHLLISSVDKNGRNPCYEKETTFI